jgi:valyl-tRNA synthetase
MVGHRIPAWYDKEGNYVVAATEEELMREYAAKYVDSQWSTVADTG